jgi:hypothetical protein
MSYVWRSILKGLQVLKKGIIWRIGDGSRVRIWEDPWFPSGVTRQPTTHKGDDCELERVSQLINQNSCTWNRELIVQYFLPGDVPIILSIPLREESKDFVAWHFDPKGFFSVKSAYKVHVESEKQASVAQAGSGSN